LLFSDNFFNLVTQLGTSFLEDRSLSFHLLFDLADDPVFLKGIADNSELKDSGNYCEKEHGNEEHNKAPPVKDHPNKAKAAKTMENYLDRVDLAVHDGYSCDHSKELN
jgi:hypothetical protein